mgnify:CR=1 FL=1
MYKQAAMKKFRFETPQGYATIEDLFDLPLTSKRSANLNDIAIGLYQRIQGEHTISFVGDAPSASSQLTTMLELVKDVIATRKEELARRTKAAESAVAKQKIMAIIEQKNDAALSEKSIEELQAELAKM